MGRKILYFTSAVIFIAAVSACTKGNDTDTAPDFSFVPKAGNTLFVANEGTWNNGNGTLSVYDTMTGTVENDVFFRANGFKLGDTPQSMTLYDGTLWITVNSSNIIFAVDPVTFKEKGRITGTLSPRYIHFVSDDKAYVTQMSSGDILVVNPQTYSVTGKIETGAASTEQMVQCGSDVMVNCWSSQKEILKIDTGRDEVTGRLEVGIQPAAIQLDKDGMLWVLNDGSNAWPDNPAGSETPSLKVVDPETFTVERSFLFDEGSSINGVMTMNAAKDSLFFLNDGVWAMSIYDQALPAEPLFKVDGAMALYDMTVSPENSEIYVSDALDYQQNGIVCRYSMDGELRGTFTAGINPGSFCWY